jgi:hypothetical protein
MFALGRLLNPVSLPPGNTTWVNLRDAATVTFLAVGASGTTNITFQVAQDAAGTGAVNYDGAAGHGDGVTVYWSQHSGLWTQHTQNAAATVPTTSATGDITAVEINGVQLPDGFTYINAVHATATVVACLADLVTQRSPEKLVAPTV